MTLRSTTSRVVKNVVGQSGLERVKSADRRVRRAAIRALDVEARAAERRRTEAKANAPTRAAKRLALIDELGRRDLSASVNQEDLAWASSDPFTEHPEAPLSRHELLAGLHRVLQPRTYFEIGVRFGESLALSRTRTIGVDPAYAIRSPLHCDLRTFCTTSDAFFERSDAFDHFGGTGIDLAFIDGMHLSEYVLRDFINTEAHAAPGGIVVLDDVLPRNDLEAYRIRRTGPWTGDVFKVLEVLRTHRPDLTLVPLNTSPTGTLLIAGLDPTNTVLRDAYDQIEPDLLHADPQTVPAPIQNRQNAVDPRALLDSAVLAQAAGLRDARGDAAAFAKLYAGLDDLPRYGDTPS